MGGKYSVVKGTADKMLDHMLETEIEERRNGECERVKIETPGQYKMWNAMSITWA